TRRPATALVGQGTVLLDAQAVAACAAAYQRAATACTIGDVLTACQGVFVGTKADGEPCATLYECRRDQGPATCLKILTGDTTPALGICRRAPHASGGDPCVFSCQAGDDCSTETIPGSPDPPLALCFEADGLYCSTAGDTPVCAPLAADGAACDSGSDVC